MHARVIGGLVAWIAGAVMATALSLSAISALGQGMSADPVRTLTGDDVARALAAAGASASAPASTAGSAAGSAVGASGTTPAGGTTTTRSPAASRTAPVTSPAPQGGTRGQAVGSDGGTALAVCGTSGVYLTSWSPAQGYQVQAVSRGPGRIASVTFASGSTVVVLRIGCPSGVPTALGGAAQDDSHHGGDDH